MSQAGVLNIINSNPQIPTSFITDNGTAIPIANQLELLGDVALAGTTPLTTDGSGNVVTILAQISQAVASPDVTKIGLANFDSASFTVDADGFVELSGSATGVTSLNVDVATAPGVNPVSPDGAGVIDVNGVVVANHSVPIETHTYALNVLNIEVQHATSAAASDGTKSGVAHFNSSQFTVSGEGFVSLLGGGLAIDSVAVQSGTSPVVPTAAGLITVNGAVVSAGTTPVQSNGTGANTLAIEVQTSQAVAATDATKIGLCNFDSSIFTVDANGFVELATTGLAETITGDSGGALSPIANNWNILGSTAAAGTSPLSTIGAGATLTVTAQISQAIAATDATKIGLANFDSSSFTVDANGFVQISSTGLAETITGNSGGALSPTASNWNIYGATVAAGTSPVATSGSGSTLTTNVQISQAVAATDATVIGLAAFDSASFAVDANGFVTSLSSPGITWTDTSGAFSPLKDNGYFITTTANGTLPASPSQGDTIKFFVDTTNILTITAPGSQIIRLGSSVSSAGGTIVSTAQGDSVELTYRSSDTCWCAIAGFSGNWTLT
jgi:hypothetical protein